MKLAMFRVDTPVGPFERFGVPIGVTGRMVTEVAMLEETF